MAYRSLTSAHPLAFSYPGGASSSDGPAILLEQSPARSKAPSDGPSEFSSWHDDASSSLAPSGTARDGTITVNPLIMRMGEHLKGKLQGMIRQRFENYLHIIKTLQNDIGKLAALTCELRMADHHASAAAGGSPTIRVSISCNEDGTFVVYTVPDAAGVLGATPPVFSSWGGPASDNEFWKQADAAAALHKDLVRKHRLRNATSCREMLGIAGQHFCAAEVKSVEIWRALAGFEELLEAMDQRFAELWDAEMHEANSDANERSDGYHGHRLLLESMQQRLLDQQTLAQRLREDLSAAKLEEERAQDVAIAMEAEVKLIASAKAFEMEMRELADVYCWGPVCWQNQVTPRCHGRLAGSTPASSEGSPPHSTAAAAEGLAVLPTHNDKSDESVDLLGQWVHKVCEFGMSGRCHSLTALFHFGYTTWKQLMHGTQSAWGMESVEDVSPGHIAEEEEKQIQEVPRDEAMASHSGPQRTLRERVKGTSRATAKMEGPSVKAAGNHVAESRTLLTKLHELRSSKTHAITESIKKKVESQLAAPSSPCLSTATHDSGVNSRESTRSLTPREVTPETSPSEATTAATPQTWRTDKEISGVTSNKERDLQPWVEPGGCSGTLEELSSANRGEWDQFKANAELFGYVSTFKDDLSQYSTTIDVAKLPEKQRKKAERVAKEIELRQCCRGAADEEPLDAVDEEDLFSAVQRDEKSKAPKDQELHAVSGSFFHVDGVGLVDETVVRSHPWMLNKCSVQNAVPTPGANFLSTQPQGGPAVPGLVLSTNPVAGGGPDATQRLNPCATPWPMPSISPGMPVVLEGLTNAPHFNGLSAMVESFDVETNRYNVQLPIMDRHGAEGLKDAGWGFRSCWAHTLHEHASISGALAPLAEDACAGLSSSLASCAEEHGTRPQIVKCFARREEGFQAWRSPEQLLASARAAAESERLRQASELCTEALDLLWSKLCSCPSQPATGRTLSLASSSSSAPAPAAAIWRGVHGDVLVPDESSSLLCDLLCLRASVSQIQTQYEAKYAELRTNLEADCKRIVDDTVRHAQSGMERYKNEEHHAVEEMKEEYDSYAKDSADVNERLQQQVDDLLEEINKLRAPMLNLEEPEKRDKGPRIEEVTTPRATAGVESKPMSGMDNIAEQARDRLNSVFNTPIGRQAEPSQEEQPWLSPASFRKLSSSLAVRSSPDAVSDAVMKPAVQPAITVDP
eukprot:s1649_g11.t3